MRCLSNINEAMLVHMTQNRYLQLTFADYNYQVTDKATPVAIPILTHIHA